MARLVECKVRLQYSIALQRLVVDTVVMVMVTEPVVAVAAVVVLTIVLVVVVSRGKDIVVEVLHRVQMAEPLVVVVRARLVQTAPARVEMAQVVPVLHPAFLVLVSTMLAAVVVVPLVVSVVAEMEIQADMDLMVPQTVAAVVAVVPPTIVQITSVVTVVQVLSSFVTSRVNLPQRAVLSPQVVDTRFIPSRTLARLPCRMSSHSRRVRQARIRRQIVRPSVHQRARLRHLVHQVQLVHQLLCHRQ